MLDKANPLCENDEDFFRITIFIPYLYSLILALRDRFSPLFEKTLSLKELHQKEINNLDKASFQNTVGKIVHVYGNFLPNFAAETMSWFDMWKIEKGLNAHEIDYSDLVEHVFQFSNSFRLYLKQRKLV